MLETAIAYSCKIKLKLMVKSTIIAQRLMLEINSNNAENLFKNRNKNAKKWKN